MRVKVTRIALNELVVGTCIKLRAELGDMSRPAINTAMYLVSVYSLSSMCTHRNRPSSCNPQ